MLNISLTNQQAKFKTDCSLALHGLMEHLPYGLLCIL